MSTAGELLVSGLPAGPLDDNTRDLLATAGFAGYLLLRRNAGPPDELAALIDSLDPGAGPPKIIAIDEEGGMVSRLDHLGLRAPSAMALAANGDPDAAGRCARLTGRVLRAFGINVVLGPCLDVLTQPRNPVIATRSFGSAPVTVARFGRASLLAYRGLGLAPVVKHFPGHGGTILDSHVDQPEVNADLESMRGCELEPFRHAIESGVEAVMTAHVRYPRATPAAQREQPATLSSFWLSDVLRDELSFDGVVMADSLEMQGVAGGRGLETVLAEGLEAGVDLFLCEDLEDALRARGHLLALAEAGQGARERIERATGHVRAWRAQLERGGSGEAPTAALIAVAPELLSLQRGAIEFLAGSGSVLPLARETPFLFVLPRELDPWRPADIEFLRGEVTARFPNGRVVALEPEPTRGEIRLLGELVGAQLGLAVVLGVLGRTDTWLPRALAALRSGNGTRVGVALHAPIDVQSLPEEWTRLLTYGFGRPALTALLDVLAGTHDATGRLV